MKYKFFGNSTSLVGKPLWEIVGNLKNFGIGRMVVKSEYMSYPEPYFLRIVKVIPNPPKKSQFEDRNVIVWAEEVFKGKAFEGVQIFKKNDLPTFQLIPKMEEEKYLKWAEEYADKDTRSTLQKYTEWPPLYKILWEANNKKHSQMNIKLPPLKTILDEDPYSMTKLGESEETRPKYTSNLYKENVPVKEMILEIAHLERLLNLHSPESEANDNNS